MKQEEGVDITSFDAVKESEDGFELEMLDTAGNGTGVTLYIHGKHADVVVGFHRAQLNRMMRDEQMARRRGKQNETLDLVKLNEQNREDALIRVKGWKGVRQEFSPELLRSALVRNPHWIDQIIEASNDLGNFTKSR